MSVEAAAALEWCTPYSSLAVSYEGGGGQFSPQTRRAGAAGFQMSRV